MNNRNVKRLANAPKAENEIYVGPDWINETGKPLAPLRRVPMAKLTEEEIIEREMRREREWELRWSWLWPLVVCSLVILACGAWLFSIIWKALQP